MGHDPYLANVPERYYILTTALTPAFAPPSRPPLNRPHARLRAGLTSDHSDNSAPLNNRPFFPPAFFASTPDLYLDGFKNLSPYSSSTIFLPSSAHSSPLRIYLSPLKQCSPLSYTRTTLPPPPHTPRNLTNLSTHSSQN